MNAYVNSLFPIFCGKSERKSMATLTLKGKLLNYIGHCLVQIHLPLSFIYAYVMRSIPILSIVGNCRFFTYPLSLSNKRVYFLENKLKRKVNVQRGGVDIASAKDWFYDLRRKKRNYKLESFLLIKIKIIFYQ